MSAKRTISSASCSAARGVWVACLAFCVGAAGVAHGQAASKRIAALDLIPIGVSDVESRQTTELLRRAVGRNPRYRLAPAPLRLRPMLLALGCAKLDATCLAKIGKQLDVDVILYGELVRQAGVDRLTVQLFDVAGGKVLRTETRDIADPPAGPAYMLALEDTTQLALGDSLALTVEANVEGAIILVNGQPVGTTPFAVTEGLRAGANEVIVRRPGFEAFKVRVIVRPGRAQTIRAELKKVAAGPVLVTGPDTNKTGADGKPGEAGKLGTDGKPLEKDKLAGGPTQKDDAVGAEPFYKKWWFWTVVGVVVVGGASAGIAAAASGGSSKAPSVGVEF